MCRRILTSDCTDVRRKLKCGTLLGSSPNTIPGHNITDWLPSHFSVVPLQDSEVGFYAEWLSADADGVTADMSAGDVAGRSAVVTGCASLDPRRHSVLSAVVAADSFAAPHIDVKLDNR